MAPTPGLPAPPSTDPSIGGGYKNRGLKRGQRRLTDEILLDALRRARGIRSVAAQLVEVTPMTFYKYLAERKEALREQLQQIEDTLLDHVESKLLQRIDSDDTTATIFFLRTRAKHRGYVYGDAVEGQNQSAALPNGKDLVAALEQVLARRAERERLAAPSPVLELTVAKPESEPA